MATPHVAGALALVWDAHPTWTMQQAIDAIKATVDVKPAFQGISVTGGRLNVDAAIRFGVVDVAGPSLVSSAFSGDAPAISNLRVTFSEAINALSFNASDVSFTGPGGGIGVIVTPVPGSTTEFDVAFDSQSAPGDYTMVIGPGVTDLAGNAMNQDGEGPNGETPDDQYTTTRNIPPPDPDGPQVTAASFSGLGNSISSARVTFNEAIDATSFAGADVAFTGPGGGISVTGVAPVAGTGNTQFDLTFATQTTVGTYAMTIGPDVKDLAGNAMNQDGELPNGETPDDQFTISAAVTDTVGARVTSASFAGPATSVGPARFTFDEAINPASFDASDVSFTGPGGSIGVTGVAPVAGTGNTQFDVTFATQTTAGVYTMTIGPDILDVAGNLMNQNGDGQNGGPGDLFSLTRTISSTQVFNSTDVNKPIADVRRTISVLTINQDISIADLNVTMNLSHTWDSDLRVTLIGPDGTQRILVNRRGGSGNNFTTTTFNDEAATSITSGAAPFNGSFRPEQALTGFDGKNARGTWQLVIDDLAAQDVGRINAWSLTIQT